MSDLIAFHVYRTETLELKGNQYTVSFTKRSDQEEYALFAVSANKLKSCHAFYSREVAEDFKKSTDHALEDKVYKILEYEIERSDV